MLTLALACRSTMRMSIAEGLNRSAHRNDLPSPAYNLIWIEIIKRGARGGVKRTIHGLVSTFLMVLCASQAVAQKRYVPN
jgi:hypothetical protein